MTTKKTTNKPGPKPDPEISRLSRELAVTRQRAAAIKREGGSCDEIRELRAQKLTLEIAKLQVELDHRRSELVLRKDMVEAGRKLGAIISQSYLRMGAGLPAELAGLGELRICEILRATFDRETEAVRAELLKI